MDDKLKKLLDEALHASDLAWWEWQIQSNKVISNDLKATMLGYDPEKFRGAGYQAYTDLLHPDDYERTMQAMRDHLEGRAAIYQIDYRIRRADGEYTWYMDRGSIIERDDGGKPLRLRGIVVDLGPALSEKSKDRAMLRLIRHKLPSSEDQEKITVICSSCKNIKIRDHMWVSIDPSFEKIFGEKISHGICDKCIKLLYPNEAEYIMNLTDIDS